MKTRTSVLVAAYSIVLLAAQVPGALAAPSASTGQTPIPSANTFNTPHVYQPPQPPMPTGSLQAPSWRKLSKLEKARRAAADQFLYRSEVQKLVYAQRDRVKQLVQELKSHQYPVLEADLDQVNADFFRDPANELGYRDVIYGFAGCSDVEPTLKVEFQWWVSSRPKSAWAHLLMGMYYQAEACHVRGQGWADSVTDQQWQAMNGYLAEAGPELEQARQLDPKLPPLYWTLIVVAKMTSNLAAATEAMNAATKVVPTSYIAAAQYMEALSPRWLGSYEQMDAFAESMVPYLDKNPRYWDLQGYSEAERGDRAYDDNDFRAALEHYHAALSFADYRHWLVFAGEASRMLDQDGDALAFYRRDARYEKPPEAHHQSMEGEIILGCRRLPQFCKFDPKVYPWYEEPGPHDSADDNPLK